jgi:hypothetical protein
MSDLQSRQVIYGSAAIWQSELRSVLSTILNFLYRFPWTSGLQPVSLLKVALAGYMALRPY